MVNDNYLPPSAFMSEVEVCRRVKQECGNNAKVEAPLYYKDGRPANKRADLLIKTDNGVALFECKTLNKSQSSGGIASRLASAYHEAMIYRDMGAVCFRSADDRLREIKFFGGFVYPFIPTDRSDRIGHIIHANQISWARLGLVTLRRVENYWRLRYDVLLAQKPVGHLTVRDRDRGIGDADELHDFDRVENGAP